MALTAASAWWFLPVVLPICLYVAYTDLARMKITNPAVVALLASYVLLGPVALDGSAYLWGFAHLGVVLLAGLALNIVGGFGAGDAKFLAAAAPFVAPQDVGDVFAMLLVVTLAAFATHRIVRASPLRQIAPHWASWHQKTRFPLGLALGPTLGLYLLRAALGGA